MREYFTVKDLKNRQLVMLSTLHDYCEEEKLTYWIAYGSLIGAVRHKGYIPWDDDIDVIMPRDDYDKLVRTFNSRASDDSIRIVSYEIDKEYYLPFAKLIDDSTILEEDVDSDYKIGIYLDIFPLDDLSDSLKAAKKKVKRAYIWNKLLSIKFSSLRKKRTKGKTTMLRFCKLMLIPLNKNFLINRINNIGVIGNSNHTEFVGVLAGIAAGNESRIFKAEWFNQKVLLPFEGKAFYAPIGYDAFLTRIYGDYLTLPPEDEQKTHHVFKAWEK